MAEQHKGLQQIYEHYHVRRLMLFGSVVRGEDTPESDLDLLVEFQDGAKVGFFDLAEMEIELAQLYGRRVDLRTPLELSRYLRDEVIRTAGTVFVS